MEEAAKIRNIVVSAGKERLGPFFSRVMKTEFERTGAGIQVKHVIDALPSNEYFRDFADDVRGRVESARLDTSVDVQTHRSHFEISHLLIPTDYDHASMAQFRKLISRGATTKLSANEIKILQAALIKQTKVNSAKEP